MNKSPSTVDSILAQWHEQAERIRQASAPAGIQSERWPGMTGLEILRDLIAGRLAPPPIHDTMDFMLIEAGPGRAVFQGAPQFKHYNPMGTVHGGWFATLLDSAVACAIHTTLPRGKSYTTVELKINVVRPLTEKVGLVRAEGTVIHSGNRLATAIGKLHGPDGKLYAHASTTCFVMDI